MATFIENQTDEEGNPKRILLDRDEIELGILKQLFYKVNYKKIPQSRYRKLHKINWKKIWAYLILGHLSGNPRPFNDRDESAILL